MFHNHDVVYRTPCSKKKNDSSIEHNCDMCTEGGWVSETDVEIHKTKAHDKILVEMRSDKKRNVCLICNKEHYSKFDLKRHVKSEHLLSSEDAICVEHKIFICHYCSQIFFNKRLLSYHIVKKHICPPNYHKAACPKCGKIITLRKLWFHLERHSLQSVNICPICLDKCSNKADLHKHIDGHSKVYDCSICSYETKRESFFKEHMLKHKVKKRSMDKIDVQKYFVISADKRKNYCNKYIIQYPLNGLTLYHLHLCVLCKELCENKESMKSHLLTDHGPDEQEEKKRYVCMCGEVFYNNVLLKQHMLKRNCHNPAENEDNEEQQIIIIEQEVEEEMVIDDLIIGSDWCLEDNLNSEMNSDSKSGLNIESDLNINKNLKIENVESDLITEKDLNIESGSNIEKN